MKKRESPDFRSPDVGVSATDLNDRILRSLPFIYLNPEKGTPFVWNFLIWAIIGSTPSGCRQSTVSLALKYSCLSSFPASRMFCEIYGYVFMLEIPLGCFS